MPCYSVVLNSVELDKIGDHDLLEKALKEQYGDVYRRGEAFDFVANGYSVTIRSGEARSQMDTAQLQAVVGEIKQAYSRQTVYSAAKRFGWTVKKGKDLNNFVIVKN